MALEYPEELLKYSKGEGENRIVQLYSFPQVGLVNCHYNYVACVADSVCMSMCVCDVCVYLCSVFVHVRLVYVCAYRCVCVCVCVDTLLLN